jgi:hypothetical protein
MNERFCASCGVMDGEAHHVQYLIALDPVTSVRVDESVSKHIICCAHDGCEVCARTMEEQWQTS